MRNTRFVALVLALIIVSAPIASTTCQAMCAERDAHSTSAHHACHEHMVAQGGPAVAAIHVCGHDESLPTSLERVVVAFAAPAVTSTVIVMTPPTRESASHVAFIDSSPPTALPPTSQLRI